MKFFLIILFSFIAIICEAQEDELVPYRRANLWGYANYNGEIVVQPKYLKASFFNGGLAIVEKTKGKFVRIDQEGKETGKANTSDIKIFSTDNTMFEATNISYAEEVSAEAYSNAGGNDKNFENGKFGYKSGGKNYIPFLYDGISYACKFFAIVKGINGKWGLVTKKDTIVNFDCDKIEHLTYQQGCFIIKRNNKYGLYNLGFYGFYDTHIKLDADFDAISMVSIIKKQGGRLDQELGGKWMAIVKIGNLFGLRNYSNVTSVIYSKIDYLSGSFFRVVYKGKVGYVNTEGREYFE
jgi:hypothetical protein